MDAYEHINPKRFKRVLILVIIGFFLSIGLGILLFMLFVDNWQYYFDQFITGIGEFTGMSPVMAYILGSGFYSLNASSPFFQDIFGAIGPEVADMLNMMILPAILTWVITGFVMGFFCKRWDDGVLSGLLCSLIVWVFIVITSRITIAGGQTFGIFELGYILVIFMMLVNSAAAILLCMGGGMLGGLLYSKVLFREQSIIEDYV